MEQTSADTERERITLCFNLGTFEGFNFRVNGAIERTLTADEVVNWDHDKNGEAEFWPSGDKAEVALVFSGKSAVCAGELIALDRLLKELGEASSVDYLRIYWLIQVCGEDIGNLTTEKVEDLFAHVFEGTSFLDLRKEAAYELFELYHPEAYKVWESCHCDGLIFDEDRFLDSPSFSVEEVVLGDRKALIVVPQ